MIRRAGRRPAGGVRRDGERGFHSHNPDCLIVVAIIGILAAIALPQFLQWKFSDHRDCLRALTALPAARSMQEVKGAEVPVCPATEQPYVTDVQTTGTGEQARTTRTSRCPDPETHLGVPFRLVDTGEAVRLHAVYPPLERRAGDPEVDEGLWGQYTELHASDGAVTVRQWTGGLSRLVLWGALLIGLGMSIAFVVLLAGRIGAAEWSKTELPLGCFFILGFVLLFVTHHGLGAREVRVERATATLTVQDRYWLFDGTPFVAKAPPAVWALPGSNYAEVLYVDEAGEPAQRMLFRVDPDEPALLGPVHAALYGAATVTAPDTKE